MDDWGDGFSNMFRQIVDLDFEYMVLVIGLEFVNYEVKVVDGIYDSLVIVFGEWIKSLG